jgi:hypothetical protein
MNFRIWIQSRETQIATPRTVSARSLQEAISQVEGGLDDREFLPPRRHEVELQPGVWLNIEGLVEFALDCDTAAVYRGLFSRISRGLWRPHEGKRPLLERLLHRYCLRLG